MKTLAITATLALLAGAGGCCCNTCDDSHAHAATHCDTCVSHGVAGQQGLDWFKSLAAGADGFGGTWRGEMPSHDTPGKMDEVRMNYKVVANGTAVCETLFPGTPHEMVTMYHLDNGVLTATHYCAMGNQPRMSAKVCACDTANKTCAFTFRDGTNMDPAKDDCMGRQEYTFVGPDTLKIQYHHLGPGNVEKTDHAMPAITLTRVKKVW